MIFQNKKAWSLVPGKSLTRRGTGGPSHEHRGHFPAPSGRSQELLSIRRREKEVGLLTPRYPMMHKSPPPGQGGPGGGPFAFVARPAQLPLDRPAAVDQFLHHLPGQKAVPARGVGGSLGEEPNPTADCPVVGDGGAVGDGADASGLWASAVAVDLWTAGLGPGMETLAGRQCRNRAAVLAPGRLCMGSTAAGYVHRKPRG